MSDWASGPEGGPASEQPSTLQRPKGIASRGARTDLQLWAGQPVVADALLTSVVSSDLIAKKPHAADARRTVVLARRHAFEHEVK